MKKREKEIMDLTLLLMYLESWKEDKPAPSVGTIRFSAKGFYSIRLDTLEELGFIGQHRGDYRLTLTRKGAQKARRLRTKYQLTANPNDYTK